MKKIISMSPTRIQTNDNEQRMTSLEIAEVTGKQQKNVMRDIRKMEPAWEKVQGGNFSLLSRIYKLPHGARMGKSLGANLRSVTTRAAWAQICADIENRDSA